MTELEQQRLEKAQAFLESRGWEVKRPLFDDPYEIMFRRMMATWANDPDAEVHPQDDYMSREYEWSHFDSRGLAFLKAHFVLKTDAGDD